MKKFILVAMGLLLFYPIANAAEYSCPAATYTSNDGRTIHTSEARYNPNSNDCERWNSNFYREKTPHLYQSCLEDRKFREQQVNRGECKQIN